MESCRPQRVDMALASALRDVPVPEHLAERLLDRLVEARAATVAAAGPPRRVKRRWLAAGAAALGAAAALLAAAWLYGYRGPAYNAATVLDEATEFFRGESPAAASPPPAVAPPAEYPISREVLRTPPLRWRPIRGLLGAAGVAYDLSAPGGRRATLYVLSQAVADLPTQPPLVPRPTTAGCWAAAWHENGLLYVLVVDGGPGVYRGCLRLPSGPLA
jgi:hypothetical protein